MNRPWLEDGARRVNPFLGPIRTVVIVLLGAAALIVVGPVLGRGFEPGSGPTDFVTVPGSATERGGPDGLVGAVSGALRALVGVRASDSEPVPTPAPDVASIETEVALAEAVSDQPAFEIALAQDLTVEPVRDFFAFAALPLSPILAAENVAMDEPASQHADAGGLTIAEASAPPVVASEPAPRPQPVPTRAPLLPAGLNLTVVPTPTALKPPPRAAPVVTPTPNRQPRAAPTSGPAAAAPTPTRTPMAAPTPRPRVERERRDAREVSRDR